MAKYNVYNFYLKKLVKNNIKNNKKDYLIHFITLTFSIAFMYMFNSLNAQFELLNIKDTLSYKSFAIGMMAFISISTSFLTTFLIIYSNKLLILKRKKEFAIYYTLGMSNKDIAKLLFKENSIIVIFSLLFGLIIGFFFSQALSIITGSIIGIEIRYLNFIFSPFAVIFTIILTIFILLITRIFSIKHLKNVTIIDLLKSAEKNEKIIKLSRKKYIVFIMAILSWIIAYYILVIMPFSFGYNLVYMIIFISIGNSLIIFSGMDTVVNFLKRKNHIYNKGMNSYTVSQLRKRISSTSVSLSVITSVLFTAFLLMPLGINMGKDMKETLNKSVPYDFSISFFPKINDTKKNNNLISRLELELEKDKNMKKIEKISVYKGQKVVIDVNKKSIFSNEYMKLTDYNKIRSLYGLSKVHLNNNQYIFNNPSNGKKTLNRKNISINRKQLTLVNKSVPSLIIENTNVIRGNGQIIVNDLILKDYKVSRLIWNGNYIDKNYNLYNKYSSIFPGVNINTKQVIKDELTTSNVLVSYLGVYVSLILVLTSISILVLHLLGQEEKSLKNYKILNELGFSKKLIKKSSLQQQLLYCLVPFMLAIFHAIAFHNILLSIYTNVSLIFILKSIFISFFLIFLLFIFYFLLNLRYSNDRIETYLKNNI